MDVDEGVLELKKVWENFSAHQQKHTKNDSEILSSIKNIPEILVLFFQDISM